MGGGEGFNPLALPPLGTALEDITDQGVKKNQVGLNLNKEEF